MAAALSGGNAPGTAETPGTRAAPGTVEAPAGTAVVSGLAATRPLDVREAPGTGYAPRQRRRPYALLAVGGAFAAVVAAGVLATGMLSSAADQPDRDRALPAVPTPAPADPTKPVPPPAKASPQPSAAPSAQPRLATPPPSPTRASESPSSSPPPPTARATGSVGTTPPPRHEPTVRASLAEGDKGPEVAELQERLAQLHLYAGEPDGVYTRLVSDAVTRYQWARGLTDDPRGQYGRETRRSLEAETHR
ncbi:peptidoglycan-binding protein [Streptomyces alfalfae]|uniref:Peptidoglycan binding-like domain-containing protein n=1 Tax=Streptomyces alfalfae TaxID=1642299 RepID=A0ABM6GXW3_9ACTN|nr:hypothetical protein A7J05_25165 [Streptomyces alfalfae]AYA18950.1 peptidoglycan-binding protein [Streptomyces fradiae]RXX36422.1 peptidoglycan-binding protein [Streptomyces alfalfae]RZM90454.1 peptidoglycan-binding protein [Streptomyces alfalfae]